MGRTVVNNPKNSSCLVVGWLFHHLGYEAIERNDAAFMLAATKQLNPVHIKGSNVSPRTTSFILMFHPHRQTRLGWIGLMATGSSLNAGLFIGTKDKFVVFKLLPAPDPFIKIKNSAGFDREKRIPWKNPGSMLPGTDSIFIEPSPYRTVTDGCYNAALACVSCYLCSTPTRKGYLIGRWQFTSDSLDLNDQVWGKRRGDDPAADVLQVLVNVVQKNVFATC